MSKFALVVMVSALAGILGTGLGGVVAAFFKKDSSRTVSLLLSFASGVMLSIVCFDLISEAILPDGASTRTNIYIVLVGILIGFGAVYLLNTLIDRRTNKDLPHISQTHPKTADALDELIHFDHYSQHQKENNPNHLFIAGLVMASAIALHNLPEGMAIGAAYASDIGREHILEGGLLLAVIIGLHNIPEGMAVSVPLISGGMKRGRALLVTAASGVPTVIGAMVGYSIGNLSPIALSLSLSFASGAMLYVVFGELLPESILMCRSKLPSFAALAGMLVGLLIIFA